MSKCNNFYVKQREWMITSDTKKQTGTLNCYRKVCKKKLGTFSNQGLRCNCGHFVKPAFQIAKNKVKPVGNNSTNLNIIGQNQASSSDLSKYSTDPFHTQLTAPTILYTPEMRVQFHDQMLPTKHPGQSSSVVEAGNSIYNA